MKHTTKPENVTRLSSSLKETYYRFPLTALIIVMLVMVLGAFFSAYEGDSDKRTSMIIVIAGIVVITITFLILIILDITNTHKNSIELEAQNLNLLYALSKSFDNIYFANVNTNQMFAYRMSEKINEKYGVRFTTDKYENNYKLYLENEVVEEDRELFADISTMEKVIELLKNTSEYSFTYRIKRDNQIHYFELQLLKPSETRPEFVMAFKNIDALKTVEVQLQKLIKSQTQQIDLLSSLGGIYQSMHVIDLLNDLVVELSSTKEINKYISRQDHIVNQMKEVVENLVDPEYMDAMLEFTDLTTVADRLYGKRIITLEFVGRFSGWCQATFIATDPIDEIPQTVIFTTRVIEQEKRAQKQLLEISNTDELTGLYNRRAFEDDIRDFSPVPLEQDFVYVSVDVNGLKTVNDTYGHAAGDELLKGAAMCLRASIGSYGRLYRTGGDEFAAVIFVEKEQLADVKRVLYQTVENWSGQLVKSLSISCGFVTKEDLPQADINEIENAADQKMYKEKAAYYASKGIDRRGLQAAYETVCKSYIKILKVNLTDDSYNMIQVADSEKDVKKGYNEKISLWLHDFAVSGQVYPEDKEMFLAKTKLEYLQNFFHENKNQTYCIHYRRMIGNEFKHVMMEMMPAKEYSDECQYIFLYVKNIES